MPMLRIYHVSLQKYSPPFAMCSEPLEGVDHIRRCPCPVGTIEVQLRVGSGGGVATGRSGEGRRVLARSVPSSLPSGSLWSSMVPRSPVPGEDSRYFYPLCILLPVFENTVLSNTGWSKALLSQRRDGTRSASNSGCGSPLAIRSLSVVDTGQLAYVDSSVLPWEEPVPSPRTGPTVLLARCHVTHTL